MNKIKTTIDVYKDETAYVTQSGNKKPDRRGRKMEVVDQAFQNYDFIFGIGDNDATDVRVTTELYNACKWWLQKKQGESTIKKTLSGNEYAAQTRINRRLALEKVAKECLDALRQAAKLEGPRARFDARKIGMLAKGRPGGRHGNAAPVLPLSGSYMHERTTYEQSGKQAALSGSLVYDELKSAGNSRQFADLSLQRYKQIAGQVAGGANQVVYYKKTDRLDYIVDFNGGRLYTAKTGQPIDHRVPQKPPTPFNPTDQSWMGSFTRFRNQLAMYAMDRYGNLFQNPTAGGTGVHVTTAYGAQFGSYNHSTFNAGRGVICAGTIGINNGNLVWVDNNSGHYKPTKDNLKEAIEILVNEGVDTTGAWVGAFIVRPGALTVEVFTAAGFMRSPYGQPDIGTV